jgi:Trypsin
LNFVNRKFDIKKICGLKKWDNFRGPVLLVRLGDLEISNDNDGARPQMIPVAERIPHPEYRLPGRYNDIALLRLARDAVFDGFTRPACLHRVKTLPGPSEQIKFIATGWGRVGYSEFSAFFVKLQKNSII